jgi:hypothetical protein
MKRWMFLLIVIVIAALIIFILYKVGAVQTMTAEELNEAIEIVDVETKWVEKYYQPWPPKLILVPAISFRVKNLTDKPLNYINFNSNFRFKADYENLGDAFLAAIRKEPIPPEGLSEVITLKSNYGVEGKTVDSFKDNPHWRIVIVKLFASSKGSQFTQLGEYEIAKKIDFKEPEPVHMGEKDKQ